ncbi:hypothetical protein FIBSPDRAFT_864083 [Athelia psychrophila]|uniref:Protein kinase domain-containing protein n=1 Tax=Athelia psychrophila TaxID=1759441 RepID=A0A166GTP7_9AGAM|nr:hypothetical protein FIBSPDRAFT_864083 [Fibularhizoctonia sp. CBS 109695]
MPITESNPPNPTREGDIFSLGILFLQIFDGRVDCLPYSHVPVSHRDPMDTELLKRIHGGDRPRQRSYPNISDNRWSIIVACWAADPSARPNIRQVRSWLAQL